MDHVSFQLGIKNQWGWLVRLLSNDLEWLSAKVKFFIPNTDLDSGNEAPDPTQRVLLQLRELHTQGLATWQAFIHCVCMELEVPLELEVQLLSTWGHGDGFPSPSEAGEESQPNPQLQHGLKRPHQSCGSSPRPKQSRKQQLALAKRYLQLLRTSAQQRYGGKLPGPGQPLTFHQAYVSPILQWSRATAPLDTQEGAVLGSPRAEDGADVSVQDLFSARMGKGPRVTVLLGKAGMGKTTLTRWLCQKWADGQLEHFRALFLFEFCQLNMLTGAPTLPQLLFDLYLSPEEDPDAVLQYLEENASRVMLIFDGLEEALHPGAGAGREAAGPEGPSPALALFSCLCQGTLLPGCRIMATSRPGKLPDCLPTEAATIHMWGFDGPRVEEYVGRFFGSQLAQEDVLAQLRTNRRLQSMCAVPGLCRVVCLCLHHLIPGISPGQAVALLPTVTQSYLQMVLALNPRGHQADEHLSGLGEVALRGLETGKAISVDDIPPALMAVGAALGLLTSFCVRTGPGQQETGYAFTHLSLQEFLAALHLMVSPKVDRDALTRHVTLNSRWVLRTRARQGLSDHLPTFLAGLASGACQSFLSNLTQQGEAWVGARQAAVIQALKKLATRRLTGPKVVELCHCVGETQEPELASIMARSLPGRLSFHNFPLTYADLAALTSVLGHRDAPIHLDFDGCPLEPRCPEALAGCEQVENLSFKSRKCGDAFAEALSRSLPAMGSLKTLGLAGSKITARGIHHLVQALPLCPHLEEVSFRDNQLKDQELLTITEVLPGLPRLRKLDLSHNSVSMSTLLCLTKVAVTCPTVRMLQVRKAELILHLSPPEETAAEPRGAPDLQGNASQLEGRPSRSLALRLQECGLTASSVETLIAQLQEGPHLEEVDLSGNQLEDEGCRLMAEAAPELCITRKLDLSDNGLSVEGLPGVLRALSTCPHLADLHLSLTHKKLVLTFAAELEQEEEGTQERAEFLDSLMLPMSSELPRCSPSIRLTHCGLQAEHLEQLCPALGGSCRLGRLDLSSNALGDEGAAQLSRWLPRLGPLQSLNLSENGLSLDAVLSLAQCFSKVRWVLHLDVSFESQRVILRGDRRARRRPAGGSLPELPPRAGSPGCGQRCVPRSFCLRECRLEPPSLTHLCQTLEKCPGPLEVKLSCVVLSDQSLDTLLGHLPRLPKLGLLQLSQTPLPPRTPFLLAHLLSLCPRVQKVDLRSLQDATLYFRSSQKQRGGCCGFTGCGLGQEQVQHLCGLLGACEDLSRLDLSDNQLGDDGLRCLLKCLRRLPISGSLDLSNNSISQESALCLLETLPSCPRVREASVTLDSGQSFQIHCSPQEEPGKVLRLRECRFGPEHLRRLATGLSQAWPLAELELSRCCLSLQDLAALLHRLRRPPGLLRLRVEEPWVGSTGLLNLLQVCAQTSANVTEISVSEIQQQLCIQLAFPQQESAEAVALRLAHCDLETHPRLLVRQLEETCSRLQLRQLSLSQVSLCGPSSLLLWSFLPSLSELKTFRLASSYVSSEGWAHLASGLSRCLHLEELDLSNNRLGEEAATLLTRVLEGRSPLTRLDLSHLRLDAAALPMLTQGLSRLARLQRLCLSGIGLGDVGCHHLSEALRAAASLEELGLSQNQIGDAGAQHLAAILPGLPELRRIHLSVNGIGPAGGVRLVESLALCQRLEELLLGHNGLGDPTALGLARGLPPHLRTLHLQSSRLGAEGVLSLGQALDGCPHLEEVSLEKNSLAGQVPRFCQGLPLLRQIDLASCEIDNQAAQALAASLVLCPALEEILLSWNLLGDEAAAELARILPRMHRLKRLELSWNLLGDEAAAELARILPRMHRLKRLDLEKNRITAFGAWLLAEGLVQASGVQVIRLWNNHVPPDAAQRLQSLEPRLDFAFKPSKPQAPQGT